MKLHSEEIKKRNRFSFGENWSKFLVRLSDDQIYRAEQSLRNMLKIGNLEGKRFLDIGSGSGLFSLAAKKLGATVHSFDYDSRSVACTAELKRRYFPDNTTWKIEQGSALDAIYLKSLGQWDVVYAWGVLHHTNDLWQALENILPLVKNQGQLFIAIYNDQGLISKYWSWVKRTYNKNKVAKLFLCIIHAPYLFGMRWLFRALTGRLSLPRGMTLWYDMLDWLGGYPFEVAKLETVLQFLQSRGFALEELKTCGKRMGCNEFVLRRKTLT